MPSPAQSCSVYRHTAVARLSRPLPFSASHRSYIPVSPEKPGITLVALCANSETAFVPLLQLVFSIQPLPCTSDPEHMTDLHDDDLLKHIENVRGKVLLITGTPNIALRRVKYGNSHFCCPPRWCKRAWKGMCVSSKQKKP